MLKICTVYFDGFYTPDYVERLHDSLRKHSSIDFEFVCLSDTDVKADVVLPYNHHSNCLLYTSPSPRDGSISRMPSSA